MNLLDAITREVAESAAEAADGHDTDVDRARAAIESVLPIVGRAVEVALAAEVDRGVACDFGTGELCDPARHAYALLAVAQKLLNQERATSARLAERVGELERLALPDPRAGG